MLISNKSKLTLKSSVRLRLHTVFRNLKCAPGRVQGCGTQEDTCNCAGVRGQKFHKAKDMGLLWTSSSPVPTIPAFLFPRLHLQGKSYLSSGESVLESFNCLSHHWGDFCEGKGGSCFRWVVAQKYTTVVYSKSQTEFAPLAVSPPPHTWTRTIC